MTRSCLVTGATGALGPAVVSAFRSRGYRVKALARHPAPAGLFPSDVETVAGDILDRTTLDRALSGADVVVHLAALLHFVDPPVSLQVEYERVNVSGTETLVRACETASVARIVYFSSIAVYGYSEKRILTETEQPKPDTWYARTKLDAERAILSARDPNGHPIGTVLRLAAVYGSRVKGNYLRLLRALERGRFIPVGRGDNHRALIYDKDVALAAFLAAEHPAAPGEVFNVSDGTSPTLAQIIDNMCVALNRQPPRVSIPVSPVRWAILLAHAVASPVGVRLPITPATFAKYLEDVSVESSKIREQLGFQPQYDQATGWRDAIADMRLVSVTGAL
ncbi:MAG TPA: NAD-dependent epimerase/dehydratase family protein [Thermoanaerobaculia bacterium]|nr:NAD-dependent epimerase/dehydratase family protein [Thermoanaerobaculia bacterium]